MCVLFSVYTSIGITDKLTVIIYHCNGRVYVCAVYPYYNVIPIPLIII